MTITVLPSVAQDPLGAGPVGSGGLEAILQRQGRFPVLSLIVKPLAGAQKVITQALEVEGAPLTTWLDYNFKSSILVPVDSFSFSFAAPDADPVTDTINEGDLVVLEANGIELATGIIDQIDIETDTDGGERIRLSGRDLMSQLEDQDAISFDSDPIWVEKVSILSGVQELCRDTRIGSDRVSLSGQTPTGSYLLATEPGESKLAALQRFLEGLNCIAWMAPDGSMNVGKPDMAQGPIGKLFISRSQRDSNCLSMRVVRAATSIPNIIVPVWSGQETTLHRVSKQQAMTNVAPGPSRLLKLGHRVPKSVVVSTPTATDPQGLSSVNTLKAGGANILQGYAKREMARKNTKEIDVEVVVPGHFREDGTPYQVDTVWRLIYDRANLDENMYLYGLEYGMTEQGGQKTTLSFCRLGSIVADNIAPGATT